MTSMLNIAEKTDLGPNHFKVQQFISSLSDIRWFSRLGQANERGQAEKCIRDLAILLNLEVNTIRWLQEGELLPFLSGQELHTSSLWKKLEPIPREIKKLCEQHNRLNLLDYAVDNIPESVFHPAFDGAFHAGLFQYGDQVLETAVGAALYVSGMACSWELVGDIEGWDSNPFRLILEVFAAGYWPLGWYDNEFYVL